MTKRIGILTAGGDAPGQNVCLKSVVYAALEAGFDVIGIRKGWEGLLHYDPTDPETHSQNVMPLTRRHVRDIDVMPGSFLHCSRVNPLAVTRDAVPAFLHSNGNVQPADLTAHVKRAVEKLGLDGLVVIGDRAGLAYAAHLSHSGVPVVGIPKTVHNNVGGTDYALGFSTALGRGMHFVHEVRAMAGSREEIAVVEILGRNTGLTTMLISFLAGADRTLIPEVPFDPEKLAALLRNDQRSNPNNYAILIQSELTSIEPAVVQTYLPELSRLANSRTLAEAIVAGERAQIEGAIVRDLDARREVGSAVIGTGAVVTEILENLTGQRFLYQPLSYLIRTGEPDGQDLLGAANFATRAVDLLAAGRCGRMTAYRRSENYCDVPLDDATQPAGNIRLTDFYHADTYSVQKGILWAARV